MRSLSVQLHDALQPELSDQPLERTATALLDQDQRRVLSDDSRHRPQVGSSLLDFAADQGGMSCSEPSRPDRSQAFSLL